MDCAVLTKPRPQGVDDVTAGGGVCAEKVRPESDGVG